MKNNVYNSPEILIINASASDVITASDPTLGTESPTVTETGGFWETL